MKYYKNLDTGMTWSEADLRVAFKRFRDNSFEGFEDYLEVELARGREHVGGLAIVKELEDLSEIIRAYIVASRDEDEVLYSKGTVADEVTDMLREVVYDVLDGLEAALLEEGR